MVHTCRSRRCSTRSSAIRPTASAPAPARQVHTPDFASVGHGKECLVVFVADDPPFGVRVARKTWCTPSHPFRLTKVLAHEFDRSIPSHPVPSKTSPRLAICSPARQVHTAGFAYVGHGKECTNGKHLEYAVPMRPLCHLRSSLRRPRRCPQVRCTPTHTAVFIATKGFSG